MSQWSYPSYNTLWLNMHETMSFYKTIRLLYRCPIDISKKLPNVCWIITIKILVAAYSFGCKILSALCLAVLYLTLTFSFDFIRGFLSLEAFVDVALPVWKALLTFFAQFNTTLSTITCKHDLAKRFSNIVPQDHFTLLKVTVNPNSFCFHRL